MTFSGIPIWLTLTLAAGAAAALFVLHFLYRNYTKATVPTLIFWQAVSQNTMYNRLWKSFRQLLTFIFLASILLLIIFAAARPYLLSANHTPVQYAVILDCRATMGITDDAASQTRFDKAKDLCSEFLKNSSDFDKIMLITTGEKANVIKSFKDNKESTLYTLKSVNLSGTLNSNSMEHAIAIVQAAITDESKGRIIVFTDHGRELENLPAKIRNNLSVFNVAKPVFNAAILQLSVIPADGNQSQLNVTIGCWGENSLQAVAELYEDNVLMQKQDIELTPDTTADCKFMVANAESKNLSVKLICDDVFKKDNTAVIPQESGMNIFADQNVPPALKFYIEADPDCRTAESADNADISLGVISGGRPLASVAKVIPTVQLYDDKKKIDSISNDLFAIGGSSLSNLPDTAICLLNSSDGDILAAMDKKNNKTSVWFSDCLFTEQSTFWKQPQFPELMKQIIETASGDYTESAATITPQYANLYNIGSTENARIPAEFEKQPVSLYNYLIIAALLLLAFEIYAFYKGVIV